ncbi:MAG: DUF664 domain-containing protein [Dehalococcoidia bacterium]|nr:DUF664 domain-containing protein [Dehalococcoidia bacterium]
MALEGSMERLEIIEALEQFPKILEAEVAGLTDAMLRYRPAEGEWSINEVTGHLRDVAENWYKRFYMVWSQTDPLFVSFDGEALARERAYQDARPEVFLAEMKEHTIKTVELLAHAVDWTRLGMQPGVGRRTLKQFAASLVAHEQEHLSQIRTLKSAQETGIPA